MPYIQDPWEENPEQARAYAPTLQQPGQSAFRDLLRTILFQQFFGSANTGATASTIPNYAAGANPWETTQMNPPPDFFGRLGMNTQDAMAAPQTQRSRLGQLLMLALLGGG